MKRRPEMVGPNGLEPHTIPDASSLGSQKGFPQPTQANESISPQFGVAMVYREYLRATFHLVRTDPSRTATHRASVARVLSS